MARKYWKVQFRVVNFILPLALLMACRTATDPGDLNVKNNLNVGGEIFGKVHVIKTYTIGSSYDDNKDPVRLTMTKVADSVCFLTGVWGNFNKTSRIVKIEQSGENWVFVREDTGSDKVQGTAMCIGKAEEK